MDEQVSSRRTKWLLIVLLVVILSAGIFLRLWKSIDFKDQGTGDEFCYALFVKKGLEYGLTGYGRTIDQYIGTQVRLDPAMVPATRIGFIWPATILARVANIEALRAVRWLSALSTSLLLLVSAVIGYRFGNVRHMIVVTTLMAVAPLEIFLAQRSLVDGYFALWAVLCAWFFLESLRSPQSRGWIAAYGVSLFVLVLTKENAAFVCAALMATWLWFVIGRIGRPNFALPIVTFVAGAAGVIVLASYLGGFAEWITFYRMYARKAAAIPYVIKFQDGAWYRYLIDFAVLSPGIVILVFGRVFTIDKKSVPDLFWALFVGFSFLSMAFIPYGLNVRFAAYWDQPLRWLAASQVIRVSDRFSARWRTGVLAIAVLLLVIVDLSQFDRFFIKGAIYEPVSSFLLEASKLVK